MHIIKYQRFPNNEIRATHYYKADSSKRKDTTQPTSNVTSEIVASVLDGEGKNKYPSSLTLGGILHSGDSNLPFRKTKFGLNAKNTLLRIGGAYDTLSTDPNNFVFLTGTLPGNTPSAFRTIAEYSSYIAHSIGQWLQRTIKSEHYFYVWELQKRGALHFHYCIYAPSQVSREKAIASFKQKWTNLLDDISEKSGVCLWEGDSGTCWLDRYGTLQAYAQEVHTSVAAYLSGYFGGVKDKHSQDERSPYYPRRWWGASRKSTSLLKELTEEVVIEHTSYRAARFRMLSHYEAVLHDTSHAHAYSHKIGIGSTVVSYHPEDKGLDVWQGISKMTLQHNHHPHIASLIHAVSRAHIMIQPHIASSSLGQKPVSKQLLLSLQDSVIWQATARSTLQDTHLRILKNAKSHLPIPSPFHHHLKELLRTLTLIEEFLTLNQSHLRWNKYGWLCNPEDLPYTVDFTAERAYFSTTEPESTDATGGAAHGSLSPQNSLPTQVDLWDL